MPRLYQNYWVFWSSRPCRIKFASIPGIPMDYSYSIGSKSPVFISKCAPYNFLREYRLGCDCKNIPAVTLVKEARNAWHALSDQEQSLFEEVPYLMAQFGPSIESAMRLTVNVLSPQQVTVQRTRSDVRSSKRRICRGNAKTHRKKRQQKMGATSRKRSPGIGSTRCTRYTSQFHWENPPL